MHQVKAIVDTLPNSKDRHLLHVASTIVLGLLEGHANEKVAAAIPQINAILEAV
jgi:hypothetical protein